MEDVLIFTVDNLKGISEAIEAVFPRVEVQKGIVHQIRNSLRYVSWKERKPMARDLRLIYEAATEKEGAAALRADIAESVTCGYMAGTVLVGLVLNATLGLWWAEYVAAAGFLYWLAGETREAFVAARDGLDAD